MPSVSISDNDNNYWEDIPRTPKARKVKSDSGRPSPGRRRIIRKTAQVSAPILSRKSLPEPKQLPPYIPPSSIRSITVFLIRYVFDIIASVIRMLRWPLSVLLFFIVLGRLFSAIRPVMKPLCIFPGMSKTYLCTSSNSKTPKWVDFPTLTSVQSTYFEQLLESSVGASVSLDLKKAEMATKDLIALVSISTLASKESLEDSLRQFTEDAKMTGRGLQKLSAKIFTAVDQILAVQDYSLHTIESAQHKPYSIWHPRPNSMALLHAFTESMSTVDIVLKRLILEASMLLAQLDKLEDDLSTVHATLSREHKTVSTAKEDLLSELWTMLGGNRKTLRSYEQNLVLLKQIGEYRGRALVHVVSALTALEHLNDDMEELRDRVAAPELLEGHIPVDVHIKSIRIGVGRLKKSRIRSKTKEEDTLKKVFGDGNALAIDA